jgi:hypothetical protein
MAPGRSQPLRVAPLFGVRINAEIGIRDVDFQRGFGADTPGTSQGRGTRATNAHGVLPGYGGHTASETRCA